MANVVNLFVLLFCFLVPFTELFGHTLYDLSIETTRILSVNCSRHLARLLARNKLTLFAPDSRPLVGNNIPVVLCFSAQPDINS
jgi:hypothetical protein